MQDIKEKNYNIIIKKSKRKTLALVILPNCQIEVRAPLKLNTSKIINFVKSKSRWINRNLNLINQKVAFKNKYDFKNSWDVLLADKANFLFFSYLKPFKKDDLAKYRNFISRIKLYPLK